MRTLQARRDSVDRSLAPVINHVGIRGAGQVEVATEARMCRRAIHAEETPMFELRRDHTQTRVIRKRKARDCQRRGQSLGQSFVEYVLIILFVALAVVVALSLLAPEISSIFETISSAL